MSKILFQEKLSFKSPPPISYTDENDIQMNFI